MQVVSYQKIKISHAFCFSQETAYKKKTFSDGLGNFQKIEATVKMVLAWMILSEQQEWCFLSGVFAAERLTHQLDSQNSFIKTHPRDLDWHVTGVTSGRKTREVTPTTWLKIKTLRYTWSPLFQNITMFGFGNEGSIPAFPCRSLLFTFVP